MRGRLLLVALLVITAHCQDCKVRGKPCNAHEQCCGGCCFVGRCIDTYRSCLQDLNVCKDHVCRGEENCVIYQPSQCRGCEPLPICREKRQT